jgi:Ni,Fe-hydrogenase I cytochrome b subunit
MGALTAYHISRVSSAHCGLSPVLVPCGRLVSMPIDWERSTCRCRSLTPFQTEHGKEPLSESFSHDAKIGNGSRMPWYFIGRTKNLPPQGRINAGQKLHHATTFLSFVVVAASGFVLWFGKSNLDANGLAYAAMIHDLSMLVLTVMLIGHLYFTFLYDALPAMLTGYVSEEYADGTSEMVEALAKANL